MVDRLVLWAGLGGCGLQQAGKQAATLLGVLGVGVSERVYIGGMDGRTRREEKWKGGCPLCGDDGWLDGGGFGGRGQREWEMEDRENFWKPGKRVGGVATRSLCTSPLLAPIDGERPEILTAANNNTTTQLLRRR